MTTCFWSSGLQASVCHFVAVGVILWVGVIWYLYKRKYKIQANYFFMRWNESENICVAVRSETVSYWFRCHSSLQDSVDDNYSNTVLDLKQMWRFVSECLLFQNLWVVSSDCDDVVFNRLFVVLLLVVVFCTNRLLFYCVFWMMCGWVWSTCLLCLSMAVGNIFYVFFFITIIF